MPTRNDVGMEVEDFLPGALTSRVVDVHAVGSECRPQPRGDAVHHAGDVPVGLLGDLPKVPGMPPRDNQAVPRASWSDVEERHAVLVLKNTISRRPTRNDLTEDALVHVPHDRTGPNL